MEEEEEEERAREEALLALEAEAGCFKPSSVTQKRFPLKPLKLLKAKSEFIGFITTYYTKVMKKKDMPVQKKKKTLIILYHAILTRLHL